MTTATRTSPAQHGYLVLGPGGRQMQCYSDAGTYAAQCFAADAWGTPPKQQHRLSVSLCETPDGEPYVQTADT